ncbi:MAG: hypothetical protein ACKO91_08655 [Acidimicrobiales bacterium]
MGSWRIEVRVDATRWERYADVHAGLAASPGQAVVERTAERLVIGRGPQADVDLRTLSPGDRVAIGAWTELTVSVE